MQASSVFVDMVGVSQHHGNDTPEIVGGLNFRLNEDGSVAGESGQGRRLKGSFDSSVMVRSHGGWVQFFGNPSRFERPDNLFGYDLDGCMERINALMDRLGLPRFTPGVQMPLENLELPRWTGAAFSCLHLTRNMEAGSDMLARLVMRAYQRRSMARIRKGDHGDESVWWANTRRAVKAYLKGPEMRVHQRQSEWTDWAVRAGIVRQEVELKSRVLSATGLRWWGNLDMAKLVQLFEAETEVFRRADCSLDPLAVEAVSGPSRVVYAAWLRGEDVWSLLPRSSAFRHRKVLRECASVDIREPRPQGCDVVPMVREVTLRPAVAPAGYWHREAA